MNKIYKIEWEMVSPIGAGAMCYHGEHPIYRPIDVPDEFWRKVENKTDSPWSQYNQLKEWAESGEQLIRNVKLFEAIEIQWSPVMTKPPQAREK